MAEKNITPVPIHSKVVTPNDKLSIDMVRFLDELRDEIKSLKNRVASLEP